MMQSKFANIPLARPIEVHVLENAFKIDTNKDKVNLGLATYLDEEGKSWILPVVKLVENTLSGDDTLNKETLPVLGLSRFTFLATKLLLGAESQAHLEQRAFGVQTLAGTGALRIGAEYLKRIKGHETVYYSRPSWDNHRHLFKNAGFTNLKKYRYWCEEKRILDPKGMIEDLMEAPENSVVVLHACAHNPTGCDPTQDQWKAIADAMEAKNHFPFFDCAFQGLASGDADEDAWAVRYFVSRGFELFCAQSFAKNFGLYNERPGNLTIVTDHMSSVPMMKSKMSLVVRGMYDTPTSRGARVVAIILNNMDLFFDWKQNIMTMSSRINEMRFKLRAALERVGAPGNWEHITSQNGMFAYTGITEQQARYLMDEHHIYMLRSGRISMSALNASNVEYVARAIDDAIRNVTHRCCT